MYWVIQNTPNALTRPGMITAHSEPNRPALLAMMYSGTTLSCCGIVMVATTSMSSALRPQKRSFENE